MEDVKIRLLKAGEIECRVGTISENGLSLLLYKDARADQKILDEAFGCFGWKRSHQSIDGRLYCTVEVWDGKKKEWIGKQDVGTAGSAEKEKGQASDSFNVVFQIKRAANLQIILAPYKIDVVLQPHYPETLLHITRTKILPCKLIAQEYSVSSYENGSSSSSIWQA